MRALILLIFLLAGAVYTGPLEGTVTSTPKFDFAYRSDWRRDEIINRVQNNHVRDPLVVYWKEAGISAPIERPIPPGRYHLNSYSAPEEILAKSPNAKLLYGLSSTPQAASTYALNQTAVKSQVLRSVVFADTTEQEPFRLEIFSISSEPKSIQYVFIQNRHFDIALPFPSDWLPVFERNGWKPIREVSGRLKHGQLPLKEQIEDFQSYALLHPPELKSVVSLPFSASRVRAPLLIIVDGSMNVVATGFVSLHHP